MVYYDWHAESRVDFFVAGNAHSCFARYGPNRGPAVTAGHEHGE
jgi:hypothetical protein